MRVKFPSQSPPPITQGRFLHITSSAGTTLQPDIDSAPHIPPVIALHIGWCKPSLPGPGATSGVHPPKLNRTVPEADRTNISGDNRSTCAPSGEHQTLMIWLSRSHFREFNLRL